MEHWRQHLRRVTVTATDPSGATGMAVTVNIVVTDVDEAPVRSARYDTNATEDDYR